MSKSPPQQETGPSVVMWLPALCCVLATSLFHCWSDITAKLAFKFYVNVAFYSHINYGLEWILL